MIDYSELKGLAEACVAAGEYLPGDAWEEDRSYSPAEEAFIAFAPAATPAAVLALIAENERLRYWRDLAAQFDGHRMQALSFLKNALDRPGASTDQAYAFLRQRPPSALEITTERDQLKAEVEALRKDKDRLDSIEANYWDVRHLSSPIADTGDSSTSVEIVGHWMDKPWERVIGENYNENLRAALDQAMTADAYPPARPEYPEFDDIPELGGGSGNKARRRAKAPGVDYDAALRKESGND